MIYTFPMQFTHQGASWTGTWQVLTHDIRYPPTEESMQPSLALAPDAISKYELEHYWLDHWDAHRIRMEIDAAAAWSKEHNIPVICNEFGTVCCA